MRLADTYRDAIDCAANPVNYMLGQRVNSARSAAGLTQRELAARMNVSRAKISKLELGQTQVSVADLIQVAAALDIPIWRLLHGSVAVSLADFLRADLVGRPPEQVERLVLEIQEQIRRDAFGLDLFHGGY